MPSSTTLIRSRKALHTMLSHCRPPGHNRKLQSESRDNGHIFFGTLSPLRYLFIRTLLPSRPLNSLPPRIYSVFCVAGCPHPLRRSWFHNTRFNPFNELASIPSSLIQRQLFASGRRRTSHIHRSFDRLRPAMWLFGHSPLAKLAQWPGLLGYHIPDALCVVICTVPPNGLDLHL